MYGMEFKKDICATTDYIENLQNGKITREEYMNIFYEKDEYGGTYCRVKMSEKKSRFEIPIKERKLQ